MIWLAVSVGIAALLAFLLSPAKPIFYEGKHQADLPLFFTSMLAYMRVGSVLHVQHEGSERVLLFRKVALSDGHRGFDLELPNAPWSRNMLPQVRDALSAAGFNLSAIVPSEMEPAQFVVLRNVSALQAFRVAEVAREAMQLDMNARFTMHMEGAPSLAEFRRASKAPRPSGKL